MPLRRRIGWFALLGAAAIITYLFARRLAEPTAPEVTVARVGYGALEAWVSTNGVIQPIDPRIIRAQVAAFVDAVPVVEGQVVGLGDRLLALDLAEQRAELTRAREDLAKAENDRRVLEAGGPAGERAAIDADVRKADAEAAHLRSERDATERLVAKQAATREELDQTELALTRTEATRDALRKRQQQIEHQTASSLEENRLAIERAHEAVALREGQVRSGEVRAPIAGTVYALPVRPGSRVEAGAVLAEVADLRAAELRAFVDEPDLASIEEGQRVEVTWSAIPNLVWTGKVERVPKAVVSRSERMVGEVICSVDNDNQKLIPNLGVDVRIRVRARDRALVVPRAAVRSDSTGKFVFLVQDGTLRRRAIVVDFASATSYSVMRGLAEGDEVAVSGEGEVHEGMRVGRVSERP